MLSNVNEFMKRYTSHILHARRIYYQDFARFIRHSRKNSEYRAYTLFEVVFPVGNKDRPWKHCAHGTLETPTPFEFRRLENRG
jgi:hypothetical protein